jgi:type I restriction enzyme S subunit
MGDFSNLGDLCDRITKGTTPSKSDGGFSEVGVNYIKSESLGYDGEIDEAKFARITPKVHAKLKRSQIQANDILYSIAGVNLGKCGVAKPRHLPANTNQAVAIIRVNNLKADTSFVSYCLRNKHFVRQVLGGVAQSAQPNVNLGDISRFQIPAMPLETQKAIANALSALDDKIELNRRTNETLEAMAQAIFKDWFVDFGPVHRKQAGETDPTAILGGLLPAGDQATQTAALFPDTFGDNGLPKGWGRTQFGYLCKRQKKSLKPEQFPTETFEHFSLPAYDKGLEPTLDSGDTIKSNKTIVTKGSVLLSKLNPETPRVWFPADQSDHRQISSTEFLVFEPSEISSREYLYCLFNDPSFRQILTGMVTGTSKSHQRVSPPALDKVEVLEANPSVLKAFSEIIAPVFLQRLNLRKQNQTLAQTRDYLLPKLMSGQIRTGDIETEVA